MTDIRASQLSTTSNLGISAQSDPARLARQIANDSRVGGRIDVDLARAKADQLAAKNPELAAAIRQELESQMTPVERGQLAASFDASSNGRLDQSRGTQIAGTPRKDESLERTIAKAYDNLNLTNKIQDFLVPQLGRLTKAAGLGKTEWGASLQKVLDTPGTAKTFREGINEGVINGGKEMVVGIAKLAGSAAQYGADKTLGGAGDALRGITGKMPGFLEAIVPSAKRGDASDAALGRLGSNIANYVSSRSQNPNLLTSDVKNAINSAWGSLKADHAKAAAQGPQEEARWWGETIGRVTFEVAATVVPVAGAVGKVDKARKTAAAASKADDLVNAAKLANKIPDPWAGTPSGPSKVSNTPTAPAVPKATPLLTGTPPKAGDVPANAARHARLLEVLKVTELANPLVESLRTTGALPKNFVTKAEAALKGWQPGKALGNSVPSGQLGGDIFANSTKVLPEAKGRVWFEADVGLSSAMSRAKQPGTRLLYSNDGLLFVTADHYKSVHQIGKWK
jgi:hypothetical protein